MTGIPKTKLSGFLDLLYFREPGSHSAAQVGLKLLSNQSCLSIPSAAIIDVKHHITLGFIMCINIP